MTAFEDLFIPEPTPFDQLLSLKGRVAIVTGGSRGIGEAIVLRLAQAGATVVATARSQLALEAVVAKGAGIGAQVSGVAADISSLDDAETVVEDTMARFGRVDILVNNAAIYPASLTTEMSETTWDQTIDADLKGAFFLSKLAALKMIEGGRGGRIVNILSTEIVRPTGILIAYGAAKAGLLAVTQSMAKELGQYGIQVNAVIPGTTLTEEKVAALKAGIVEGAFTTLGDNMPKTRAIVDGLLDGGFGAALAAMPLGRPGFPDDIAKAVLFMASDMASYVTGTSLMVEGAQSI